MRKALFALMLFAGIASAFDSPWYMEARQVGRLWVDQNGQAFVGWSGSAYSQPGVTLCNFAGTTFWFDATSATGKAMYSTLLSAKTTGTSLDFWFDTVLPGGGTCNLRLTRVGFPS